MTRFVTYSFIALLGLVTLVTEAIEHPDEARVVANATIDTIEVVTDTIAVGVIKALCAISPDCTIEEDGFCAIHDSVNRP